jgi:hypothetical protein
MYGNCVNIKEISVFTEQYIYKFRTITTIYGDYSLNSNNLLVFVTSLLFKSWTTQNFITNKISWNIND